MSNDPLIPIVDKNDNIIAYKPRSGLVDGDIGRITCLWVTNDQGQVLIAQRSWKKQKNPGLWSAAVAGTVEKDETYESNMIKEAEEEIGLLGVQLNPVLKFFYPTTKPFFCQVFHAVVNQPLDYFRRKIDEVEQLAWIPYPHLERDIIESPGKYVPSFPTLMRELKILYPGA